MFHCQHPLRIAADRDVAHLFFAEAELLHGHARRQIRIRSRAADADFFTLEIGGSADVLFGNEIERQTGRRRCNQHGIDAAQLGEDRWACPERGKLRLFGGEGIDRRGAAAQENDIDIEPVLSVESRFARHPERCEIAAVRAECQYGAVEFLRRKAHGQRQHQQCHH